MPLTLRRIPATTRYYTEPLEGLGDALPLQMLLIPGGTFTMGSPDDEPERVDSEGPQHEVTVPQFFMGRYPITQAQWRAVAAMPKDNRALKPDPSRFKGDNRPVEQVSWHDAVEFCARISRQTGRSYRLPTEAEWEYACRAGTTTPFHFGKTLTTEVANYDGNHTYADGSKGEYRKGTTPVDQFNIANAFGLCDMHGNVLEWCQDHWHDNYEGAPTDGSAWMVKSESQGTPLRGGSRRSYIYEAKGDSGRHVVRGGSWFGDPWVCRSAFRLRDGPDLRDDSLGFRVCCSPPRALT
jgi:formylglycine-generating enzyme required for sulfatase activity